MLAAFLLLAGTQDIPGELSSDPPCFVPNEGQWQTSALYVARGRDWVCAVEPAGFLFGFDPDGSGSRYAVRMVAADGACARLVGGEDEAAAQHSFLQGNDPARWRFDLPGFRQIRYQDLFEGIDLVVHTGSAVPVSYRLEVFRTVDLDDVEFRLEGALGMAIKADGSLQIQTPVGELIQTAPRAWRDSLNGPEIACRFELRGGDRFGFDIPENQGPLVIDPGILWTAYVGGSQFDSMGSLALNPESTSLAFAGVTDSADFPVTSGTYSGGPGDAFFGLYDFTSGSVVSLVVLGGSGEDSAPGVAYNGNRIAIAGSTTSTDFPATPGAFDTQYGGGGGDAFVGVFPKEAGAAPVFITFLGTNELDAAYEVVLDEQGRATAVGRTESGFFPITPGVVDTIHASVQEGFVTQLRPNGKDLVFSTFYGGSEGEWIRSIDVAEDGAIAIAGFTRSPDLPTSPGAFQSTLAGFQDAFVAKLSADATALLFGTYLGGSGVSEALAVKNHPSGDVFVCGLTVSPDFPTTPGAFEVVKTSPSPSGFVSRIASGGTSLVYSTFTKDLPGDVRCWDLTVDPSGVATVIAEGAALGWPVTAGAGPYAPLDGSDIGLFRLRPDGAALLYSTAIGGSGLEEPSSIEITIAGTVLFSGLATSSDFPGSPGSHQGGGDALLCALAPYPDGIATYGEPTDACLGPMLMNVTALPAPGAAFGFTCSAAPANAIGVLIWGVGQDLAGVPLLGTKLYVAPTFFFQVVPAFSNQEGWAEVPFVLPPSATGATGYAQFGWVNTAVCGGLGTLSASNALAFTVQP